VYACVKFFSPKFSYRYFLGAIYRLGRKNKLCVSGCWVEKLCMCVWTMGDKILQAGYNL